MLTDKELFNNSIKQIKDKFLNNGKFKSSDLSYFELKPIKKVLNFSYSYGYSNNYGYYFVCVNEKKEGFIYIRGGYKEDGSYVENIKVIYTEQFKKIQKIVENKLNIDKLREYRIERFYTDNWSDIPFTEERVIAIAIFGGKTKLMKSKVAEISGLIILYYMNLNNEFYDLSFSQEELEEFSNIVTARREEKEGISVFDFAEDIDINNFVFKIFKKNIKHIIENNISMQSILDKIENNY